MTIKVAFLRSAHADLEELKHYIIKHFGREAWQTSYSAIKDAVAVIQSYPNAGKIPDELAALSLNQYRQVMSGKNRIIYEIRGATAYIHIVCDTRKDLRALLMRRILRVR